MKLNILFIFLLLCGLLYGLKNIFPRQRHKIEYKTDNKFLKRFERYEILKNCTDTIKECNTIKKDNIIENNNKNRKNIMKSNIIRKRRPRLVSVDDTDKNIMLLTSSDNIQEKHPDTNNIFSTDKLNLIRDQRFLPLNNILKKYTPKLYRQLYFSFQEKFFKILNMIYEYGDEIYSQDFKYNLLKSLLDFKKEIDKIKETNIKSSIMEDSSEIKEPPVLDDLPIFTAKDDKLIRYVFNNSTRMFWSFKNEEIECYNEVKLGVTNIK